MSTPVSGKPWEWDFPMSRERLFEIGQGNAAPTACEVAFMAGYIAGTVSNNCAAVAAAEAKQPPVSYWTGRPDDEGRARQRET
jgi:hypothetical protein